MQPHKENEPAPLVVKFGSVDSSPVALQINANGTGFVRWSKAGSVACSLDDGRLFASHKNGSMAVIIDSHGNGSISGPKGGCVVSFAAAEEAVAKIFDAKGVLMHEILRGEENCEEFSWKFEGMKVDFRPSTWEVVVAIANDKLKCEFSSITGGRLQKLISPAERSRRRQPAGVDAALSQYDHEGVRSDLQSVMSQLDSIMGTLKKPPAK